VAVSGHDGLTLPRDLREAVATAQRMRREVRRMRAILRRERADLAIIATTTLPAFTLAARLERVPAVVCAAELHVVRPQAGHLKTMLGRSVVRANARLAAVTACCSQTVAAQLPPRAARVVAYPHIDAAPAGDGAAFRRRHAIAAGGPVIAAIGNISHGRGQDVAIRALADLRRDHPDARLVIAGEPHPRPVDRAYAGELRTLVDDLGLAGAVFLCGFERTDDVLAASDVVVNPVRMAEPFGRVAMEALSAGRPVVSSAVGAVPEVLEHDRHALLVAPDRPDLLAAGIRRLLAQPALAARLVADGRAHVRATFSAEQQAARFDEAFAIALGRDLRAPRRA
jgi:glycosyltransferase involved in cell wall biosynthesis